jgi:nucleotide sugar dehydrogenase
MSQPLVRAPEGAEQRPQWRFDVAVIGLGYVGLPLALAAHGAGLRTVGFDLSEQVIGRLAHPAAAHGGVDPGLVAAALEDGLTVSADPGVLDSAEIYVICVPTPLAGTGEPDLGAVMAAIQTVGGVLRPGCLVILESTPAPGTTEELVAPCLAEVSGLRAGQDFSVAFSPERIDPGNREFDISNTTKMVGGIDEESTRRAVAFYQGFVRDVRPVSSPLVAELAKLLENTYRLVNLALVQEFSAACHDLGVDAWEVIGGAATKPFGFTAFYPGPGAGGHCIPVDPVYLNDFCERRLGRPLRVVQAAVAVNRDAPALVADRVSEAWGRDRPTGGVATVLLLGISYKPDVGDTRESPAERVAEILERRGFEVAYHDPVVPFEQRLTAGRRVEDSRLEAEAAAADVVVLLQDHAAYDVDAMIRRSARFVNTRGPDPRP